MIEETMRRLECLAGRWTGRGRGNYPTIEPFEYEETLRFDPDASYPLIHYEQRTRLIPTGEASHWESGFIRPLDDGSIELSNSQDSGRVEVLRGALAEPEDAADNLQLVLASVVLDHDPRLQGTSRIFTVRGDNLRYAVMMATHTTPQPELQQHLVAELKRQR